MAPGGSTRPSNATAFSPDGRLLAAVTVEGTTLWDTATWRPVGPPLRSSQGGWQGVDFSPDGRTLAIAGGKGNVELWDVESRRELRELVSPERCASPHGPVQPRRLGDRGRRDRGQPRHPLGCRERSRDRRADRDEPTAARRRALDRLQPGLEADRRPGRSRNGRDLGRRHRAPGRSAARRSGRRTWTRRSSPGTAGR